MYNQVAAACHWHHCQGIAAVLDLVNWACLHAGKGFAFIGPKYFTGPINLNIGQTKDRDPKNPEANNLVACARLFDMTEEIMQPFY